MEQLSGLDSLFLYAESENVHQHVSAFGIYDSSTFSGGTLRFRDLLAHFERRLNTSKIFRRRLLTVPHNLDRPYWIDDPEIDIEFHVRHIALPHPGDRRQLMIQLARLHSRALDLGKPLWDIYVIEGLEKIAELPPGSFAVFLKVHHAALDTAAALQIVRDMHSTSAKSDDPVPANEVYFADREPKTLDLYTRVIGHGAKRALNVTWLYADTLAHLAAMGAKQIAGRLRTHGHEALAEKLPHYARAPQTHFNARVSPNRELDAVQFPLAQISEIRHQTGDITVNDVYLGIISGALRSYLKSKNELPENSLRALLAMSFDAPGTPSTRASRLPASLFTELRDPLARLEAIHEEMRALRQGPYAELGKDLLPALLGEMPNFAASQLMRHLLLSQVNCMISNVRGPNVPLYIAGARALQFCPVGMVADNVGLALTGFSYDGQLTVSFTACRAMLPDPAFFAQCLNESFADIAAAAGKRHAAAERKKAGRQSARRSAVTESAAALPATP